MNACILTIGDELLQGFTIDTNSSWLGLKLLPYTIEISRKVSVKDNVQLIVSELENIIKEEFYFLFITGGLGPTHDDITKEAIRLFINGKLIFNEDYYNNLKERFNKRLVKMPAINRSQAMFIQDTIIIPNDIGSAPGIFFKQNKTKIFIMPGVPNEMQRMIDKYIIPNYINIKPKKSVITIKTSGIMESKLAEKISPLIEKHSDYFRFAFLPHYNGVSLRINKIDPRGSLNLIKNIFYKKMEPYSYGYDEDKLEYIIGNHLINKKLTISSAESCTGGLIGKRLTDMSGSSKYFLGSIIAYSNIIKTSLLNIPNDILKKYGSVSEEVAVHMAKNIREKMNSDIGVSTTGISGPTGGTKSKSVGLVYIAIVTSDKSIVKKYNFNFGRDIHREMTVTAALNLIRLNIEK